MSLSLRFVAIPLLTGGGAAAVAVTTGLVRAAIVGVVGGLCYCVGLLAKEG